MITLRNISVCFVLLILPSPEATANGMPVAHQAEASFVVEMVIDPPRQECNTIYLGAEGFVGRLGWKVSDNSLRALLRDLESKIKETELLIVVDEQISVVELARRLDSLKNLRDPQIAVHIFVYAQPGQLKAK